jgi:hypothetical protein
VEKTKMNLKNGEKGKPEVRGTTKDRANRTKNEVREKRGGRRRTHLLHEFEQRADRSLQTLRTHQSWSERAAVFNELHIHGLGEITRVDRLHRDRPAGGTWGIQKFDQKQTSGQSQNTGKQSLNTSRKESKG